MLPKAFLRLPRLPEAPARFQGPQGCSVSEEQGGMGELRGARGTRPLSLTEDPKLPKASEGSQGFLRPQGGPRNSGRLRGWWGAKGEGSKGWVAKEGWGQQGKQGSWVWLNTQGYWRLPKAPKASWVSRVVTGIQRGSGARGAREWGEQGVRGPRRSKGSKENKAPESDWRLKAAEGFLRLPRLPQTPGRYQGCRNAQGVRGQKGQGRVKRGEGEQGEQGP